MKKYVLLAIMIMAVSGLLSQSIIKTWHFPQPVLNTSDDGFTEIFYEDCYNYGPEGHPLMPHKGISLLLPQEESILEIRIVSQNFYSGSQNLKIKPAARQFPLSQSIQDYSVKPDASVYGSELPYPAELIADQSTHFLSGHGIGAFTICPVKYIPLRNEVTFLESITLEIITNKSAEATEAQKFLKGDEIVKTRINRIAGNPEQIKNYSYPPERSSTEADILLISNQALLPQFNAYISFKEATGYIVVTETTENIYASFSGDDPQDKIRNCIIDYVQNYGISWVILGGDADANNAAENIIPHRGFYCNAYSTPEDDLPTDLYYSNLDGTWDNDNDNRYGEPGEEDLYAEVAIGRFCVDNNDEINNMTQKHIRYQDAPVLDDIEKSLFLGEMLWPEPTWGGDYKDEVAFGSSNHGYTTVGLSSNFNITFLYERDGYWDKYDVFDQYSNVGVNLRNHLGHSGTTYNMLMYTSDLTTTNFTNDGINRGLAIGYSQGCYNGAFDNRETSPGYYVEDCFSEKITSIETAEVANIGNSRYGWGQHMSTDGASQYFDRQFFDAIFGEEITMIGEANRDSKEDNIGYINGHDGAIRWCYYELNLFGDPTMDIWTAMPLPIVASYPMAIPVGAQYINFTTDAPGARIGLMQDGTLIGRGLTDNNGELNLTLFDPLSNQEPIQVSIIAHNRVRHLGNIIVITDEPFVVYDQHVVHDIAGNNNGKMDFGEFVTLELTVKNAGLVDASNVMVKLRSIDPYVTIIDSSENYGDIASGSTKTIDGAFSVTIADNVPDNHLLNFDVVASADTTWISYFSNLAFGPELTILEMVVDDSQGNNNGRLDPGENAIIKVKNKNTGHCVADNCHATLSTNCYFLELVNSEDSIGTLSQLGYKWAEFEVNVDPEAPNGVIIANLNYNLASCAYIKSKTFKKKLGLLVEDFETGNFTKFNWQMSGNTPWQITTNYPYEGFYSAKSGLIGNGQSSEISLTMKTMTADTISFVKKVSSEQDMDKLKFFMNGNLIAEWSGTYQGWTTEKFYVPVGNHNFKWVYQKDGTGSAGADQAWLDYIILPPKATLTCYAGPDDFVCDENPFHCLGQATAWTSITWTTSGSGSFSNPNILQPQYYPSQDDILSGNITLTISVTGEGTSDDDTMLLTFHESLPSPAKPDGPDYVDVYTTPSSDYTTQEISGAWYYEWLLDPAEAGTIDGNGFSVTVNWNSDYLGQAQISVSAINECGAGLYSETLDVTIDNTVGIPGNEQIASTLRIIPNPNQGLFKLEWNLSGNETSTRLQISNILGEIIYTAEALPGVSFAELDLSSTKAGLYFAVISNGKDRIVRKLLITK